MRMKLIFYITKKFGSAKLNSKISQFFLLKTQIKVRIVQIWTLCKEEDCHYGTYFHFATKYKISYTSNDFFFT